MIADLMEKLTDAGFDARVNIGPELIGINARKTGVTIDIFGFEHVDAMKEGDKEFTEFRGAGALQQALAFAG